VDRPESARPAALLLAAAAQAAEAVGLCVAAVFAAIATANGQSYELSSGIALTLIALGTAAGLAAFAVGLNRARAWSRTPVVMTQLFVAVAGLYLIIGHRWDWGVPALLLAVGCLAGVFTPAGLRALNRPTLSPKNDSAKNDPPESQPAQKQPAQKQPAQKQPAQKQPAQKQPAKAQLAKGRPTKNRPPQSQPGKGRPAKEATR
jgi:hypothetical protein